jgi:BirA family biotin operon repressor/biotin-[acetyl-CoA-carboxylase] ligase
MPKLSDAFLATKSWALASGLKVWAQDEIGSTNSVAKDDESPSTKPILSSALHVFSGPSLYLARRQSQGRGRGDHTWTTPDGTALLSSWSFALQKVPQPIFSALVGLALFEACNECWPSITFNIKAPNDLFIGDKKTAGILIETIDQGVEKRTVIGLGINIGARPQDLTTATCLTEHVTVEEKSWQFFLQRWVELLRLAVLAGQYDRLESGAAKRLCDALNLHPLLKEPILRVDELGQLHSANRIIHWHEL